MKKAWLLVCAALASCAPPGAGGGGAAGGGGSAGGKADSWEAARDVEVLLTEPYCDVCTTRDKDVLLARSPILARVIELIDGATESVDVAQYTFSRDVIAEALVRAHRRGVTVRMAMDAGQDRDGSLSRSLRDAGLDVRFVRGRGNGERSGLQHAKFMIVDGRALLTGSNNWSSTGVSINEENTIVVRADRNDPQIAGFACHFEAMWEQTHDAAVACSTDDVAFTPGTAAIRMIRDEIRAARRSVDVLMHHLVFDDLVEELAKAAERGVAVRVIVNEADRAEHAGGEWERLFAAGGRIRYKRGDAGQYQLMHHKLAIVDGRALLNGSGNWSGSAFFNNFENYVRYRDPRVVGPFRAMYERLWTWSLGGDALDGGLTAGDQHARETRILFGNLHAHIRAGESGDLSDDGDPERKDDEGNRVPVDVPESILAGARFAFEYAREKSSLDFLAISPHTVEPRADDPADIADMTQDGYEELLRAAAEVTQESSGEFLALASMEWSTNSRGNHVNVLGSRVISDVERGRFDVLYDEFLPGRAWEGDRPLVMLNHPRTFRQREETLEGNWDQVYGVSLAEIANASDRSQKFNDYGLDDYEPMRSVRDQWISGSAMPDHGTVATTMERIWQAAGPYARLMEVTISRGTDIGHEHSQNPSLTEAEDGTIERVTRVHTDWDWFLLRGFRIAPAASHDNHLANWGSGHSSRTGVFTQALGEEALLAAIDQRQAYASEDENLELRFYADGRVPMGGEMGTTGDVVRATVSVSDPDDAGPYVVRVWAGRIGGDSVEPIAERSAAAGATVELELPVAGAGTHFFYVEVHAPAADRMAWSAPIWVERY
jgi:phosphatidylserine/phosphatidylglycerophosphate/cardiolipin synthase-like enzyme